MASRVLSKMLSFADAQVSFNHSIYSGSLEKNSNGLGDKFAETVVVKYEPESEQHEVETEDPERVLENVIIEMKNRLSEAREKVGASIGVERQFQDAYEGAVAQAEQWQERALITLKGRT